MVSDRGQAHTLEAFMASLLLIGGVAFALQVTAVTPLTASTSSQHVENQQLQVARGLLDSAVQNGTLKEAVLYWNASSGTFQNSSEEGYYATGGPPTEFGKMLNRTFRHHGIAFNVNVVYVGGGGGFKTDEMVHFGEPSDHAVSARRTLTLYDDDELTGKYSGTVNRTDSFFVPEIAPKSGVYNVIRVEVIVWRM